jgi:hypothetical protein
MASLTIGSTKLTSIATDMSINASTLVPSFRKDLQPGDNSSVARAYRREFRYSQEALLKAIAGDPINHYNCIQSINLFHDYHDKSC